MDGLLDAADAWSAIRPVGGVSRGGVAVYDLAVLQLALQVGRDEVPASHEHAVGCGEGCEDT
eukprot:3885274-Pleurochrysis_carterae.AAC.1